MPYPYQIWDVFTDTPLAGNPLAVVFAADGLASETCLAIAGEFNLSETIFVSEGQDGRHKARIFTPKHEMPFAGHPTVGGAVATARALGGREEVTLELPAGPAVCRVTAEGERAGRATIVAPKIPHLDPGTPDAATLAAAIGVPEDALAAGPLRSSRANSGPLFMVVALSDPSHLAAIAIDRSVMATFEGYTSTYVIAPTGEPGTFRCRMFAPISGIEEDPATGSAAVAFTAVYAAGHAPADGMHALAITQGVEMGRPSSIAINLLIEDGAIARVDLSGAAVMVAEGTLHL